MPENSDVGRGGHDLKNIADFRRSLARGKIAQRHERIVDRPARHNAIVRKNKKGGQ